MADIKLTGTFSFKCDLCTSENVFQSSDVDFKFIEEKSSPLGAERVYQWARNYECRCTKEYDIDYKVTEYPPGVHDTDSILIPGGETLTRFDCDFSENLPEDGVGTIAHVIQDVSQSQFTPEEYDDIKTAVLANELYAVGNIFYNKLKSENQLSKAIEDKWKNKIQSGDFAGQWTIFINSLSPAEFRLFINSGYGGIISAIDRDIETEDNSQD